MSLFLKWAVGPKRAGKACAVPNRLAFVAHAREALSLDRLTGACGAGKCLPERVFDRFRGFRDHLFYPFRSFHAVLLCCAAISGCATFGSVPPTVSVPVPVSCLKETTPPMPQTTDEAALLAMDDYAATLTAWTERLLLKAYSAKADALLQACR